MPKPKVLYMGITWVSPPKNTQITGSCNVVKKDIYQAQYFLVESTFSSILISLDACTVNYKETENH